MNRFASAFSAFVLVLSTVLAGVAATAQSPAPGANASSFDQGMRAYRGKDFALAREKLSQSCTMNDNAESCFYLGLMHAMGEGGPIADKEARTLFDRACSQNFAMACYNLGRLLEEARGGPLDDPLARTMFEKSCNLKFADACYSLALKFANAEGGPRDYPRTVQFYEKSCDMNYANGCFNLGIFYRNGTGGVKDLAFARKNFKRACELGKESSCKLAILPANKDSYCASGFTAILRQPYEEWTDEQKKWVEAYKIASEDGTACPPNFPQPRVKTVTATNVPAPPKVEYGEEGCANGHRHYIKTDGKIAYTTVCHDPDYD